MMPFNPRDVQRMLRRMGVKVEQLRVESAEIVLEDGSKLVFRSPDALVITARGSPPMVYLIGEYERVEPERGEKEVEVSEEDVRLVAEQAGVSLEEARRALIEAGGDLAEAILRLKGESGR